MRPIEEIGDLPLTREEEKYATCLLQKKLRESERKGTARFKTRGQPLYMQRMVMPRKGSASAKPRTVKARNRLSDKYDHMASGNTSTDYVVQKRYQVKGLMRHQRSRIFNGSIAKSSQLSKVQLLAMKIRLRLSGGQHRYLRKVLRAAGVVLPTYQQEKEVE